MDRIMSSHYGWVSVNRYCHEGAVGSPQEVPWDWHSNHPPDADEFDEVYVNAEYLDDGYLEDELPQEESMDVSDEVVIPKTKAKAKTGAIRKPRASSSRMNTSESSFQGPEHSFNGTSCFAMSTSIPVLRGILGCIDDWYEEYGRPDDGDTDSADDEARQNV
ncbi:uncharacterized protein LOC107046365 [Diachasma alloeum]|uniref:uncharacterized protein LOC107046365 n=1 Tax=Diachasma alloeum TaxID=454923 RepID=UPI0007384520|nr:uncharacterized protein LOC107046365 [Diachasma alloeum]